jgi:hypothetical protein
MTDTSPPPKPRPPLYLARQSYRRRRMMDASRLLPFFGLVLILMPLVWQPEGATAPATSGAGVYLFVVWFGLILAAAGLARGLGPALDDDD